MNAITNINAAEVLETLHPKTVKALEGLFFNKFVAAMSSTISAPAAVVADATDTTEQPTKRGPGRPAGSKSKTVETPVKRGPGRPAGSKNKAKDDDGDIGPSGRAKKAKATAAVKPSKAGKRVLTKDGRTASQVIRDYDDENPEAKATEVVDHCHSLGLKKVVPANVYNVRQNVKKEAVAAAEARAAKKAAKAKATKKTGKKAGKKGSK
jgi:hypothetical protein